MVDKLEKIEQLLKEIKNEKPKGSAKIDVDKITEDVFNMVMDKLKKDGIGKVELAPAEYILGKFQEKEVGRWEKALRELTEDQLKIGAFCISLNRNTNKSEIISKVFGKQFTGGSKYSDYSKQIDGLIDAEILKKDKAGYLKINIEDKIRVEMASYNPTEEKIQNVIDRIKRIFIEKMGNSDE